MSASGLRALAVDVGGTKIAAGLVTPDGRLEARLEVSTDRRGGDHAVAQVVALVRQLAGQAPVLGVGIAVPAVIDPTRRTVVWAPNIRGWRRVPLAQEVEAAVGQPALLEYDGHAAVVGEHWLGAARGVRNAVMLIIGTGIGGGMVLDGRLYRGSDSLAGAAGWLTCGWPPTPPPGRPFPCLERLAAGPALAQQAGVASGRAEEVLRAAAQGDEAARQALEAVLMALGRAVADIVSLLNPDLVILGGGLGSALTPAMLARIRALVRTHAQPVAARRVRVVRARLGREAGLFGAARLVFQSVAPDARPEPVEPRWAGERPVCG